VSVDAISKAKLKSRGVERRILIEARKPGAELLARFDRASRDGLGQGNRKRRTGEEYLNTFKLSRYQRLTVPYRRLIPRLLDSACLPVPPPHCIH
jgi:hypothetical protein